MSKYPDTKCFSILIFCHSSWKRPEWATFNRNQKIILGVLAWAEWEYTQSVCSVSTSDFAQNSLCSCRLLHFSEPTLHLAECLLTQYSWTKYLIYPCVQSPAFESLWQTEIWVSTTIHTYSNEEMAAQRNFKNVLTTDFLLSSSQVPSEYSWIKATTLSLTNLDAGITTEVAYTGSCRHVV